MNTPPNPMESTPVPEGAGLMRWAPLLVIALAWLAHESVRSADWVLDDVRLVRDNPDVARGPAAISRILARDAGPADLESGMYGPVTRASFALEAPLWRSRTGGLSPTGFHLTNLLLHGLCALLLLRLLFVVFPRRPTIALGAAICFAVHPIHTGTVSALMGRADLLATFFCLLAALAWRRYDADRPVWLPLAAILWWLALLSKESALGLPLALILLDVAAPRGAGRRVPLWSYAAFAVPLVLFGLSWAGLPPPAIDMPEQGPGARLLVGLEGLGRLMLLLIVPIGLRADYTDESAPGSGYVVEGLGWLPVAVVLAVTLFVVVGAARRRLGPAGLAWLLTLALSVPAMLVLPIGATLEPRLAYLGALPLFAVAGLLFEALSTSSAPGSASFARMRGALVGAIAVICLVGLTHREAQAWESEDALHMRLLERNPRHVRAMVRIARSHRRTAMVKRAEASRLRTGDPERQRLLAEREEALARAVAWGRRAVSHELGRASPDALREMGLVLLAQDKSAQALRALERAQQLDPVLQKPPAEVVRIYPPQRLRAAAELYFAIAHAREALGDRTLAADAYVIASRLNEDRNDYRTQAGLALCRVNRYAEGLTLLHEALRRTSGREQRQTLIDSIENARESARRISAKSLREGEAEQEKGRMRDAATLYEQALEIDPTSIEAWIRAGWLRGNHFGNYVRAEEYFARAEALLAKASVPKTDPTWRRISGYRDLLVEQRREEDEEEKRLLKEEKRLLEAERKRREDAEKK